VTDALRQRLARFLAGHTQNRTDKGVEAPGCTCGHDGDWREHYADRAQTALLGASMVDGQRVLAERLAYMAAERDFEKGMRQFATSVTATIADLDEEAPALRQLLRQEKQRREEAERQLDELRKERA
jgi:hypothetical protein